MLGRLLGGVAVALVLAAWVPPATTLAVEEDESVSAVLSLKASHGYRLMVLADNDGDDPGQVQGNVIILAFNHRHKRSAAYLTKGVVTTEKLKVDLGKLGRIDLGLVKSGKEVKARAPAPCNREMFEYEKTSYRGSFVFRGEAGYTSVRASRVPVSPQLWINLVCSNHFEVKAEELPPATRGARLGAELRGKGAGGTKFEVVRNRPGGRTLVSAVVSERRHGIAIARGTEFLTGGATFAYDSSLSTASVDLPAPFSGSASYRRDAKPSHRWEGNLTVDLPGRPNVPLVRPGLRPTLVPAIWSVEPPSFDYRLRTLGRMAYFGSSRP